MLKKLPDEDCRTISTKQRFKQGRQIESLMRPQTLARPDIASKIHVRSFSTESAHLGRLPERSYFPNPAVHSRDFGG
jgi:hypothetical protein